MNLNLHLLSPKPSETDSKEEKSSEPNPQKEPIETNSKDKSNEINSKEDDDTLSKPTPPQPPETKENITYFERVYMIKTLQNLQNNTPRKIRIFYYKYLIMKQLFYIRLKDKGLSNGWKDNEENGKLLIDILIHVTNNNSIEDFSSDINDEKIFTELKYVANMVSVI